MMMLLLDRDRGFHDVLFGCVASDDCTYTSIAAGVFISWVRGHSCITLARGDVLL